MYGAVTVAPVPVSTTFSTSPLAYVFLPSVIRLTVTSCPANTAGVSFHTVEARSDVPGLSVSVAGLKVSFGAVLFALTVTVTFRRTAQTLPVEGNSAETPILAQTVEAAAAENPTPSEVEPVAVTLDEASADAAPAGEE